MAAALTVSTVQSSRASSCPEDDVHADPRHENERQPGTTISLITDDSPRSAAHSRVDALDQPATVAGRVPHPLRNGFLHGAHGGPRYPPEG